jgi:hypothetical protein
LNKPNTSNNFISFINKGIQQLQDLNLNSSMISIFNQKIFQFPPPSKSTTKGKKKGGRKSDLYTYSLEC